MVIASTSNIHSIQTCWEILLEFAWTEVCKNCLWKCVYAINRNCNPSHVNHKNNEKSKRVLHCRTGAYMNQNHQLSGLPSSRFALCTWSLHQLDCACIILPMCKVQFVGYWLSDLRHLTHTPFPLSCLTLLSTAANQSFKLSLLRMAFLYDKISGFFFLAALYWFVCSLDATCYQNSSMIHCQTDTQRLWFCYL